MIEDKDMFAWKKAIREPVDKKTLPLAVKTASLIGHNIYKCLRCQKKLGFCCAYDVPYDNTLSFKKTDTCKAFSTSSRVQSSRNTCSPILSILHGIDTLSIIPCSFS